MLNHMIYHVCLLSRITHHNGTFDNNSFQISKSDSEFGHSTTYLGIPRGGRVIRKRKNAWTFLTCMIDALQFICKENIDSHSFFNFVPTWRIRANQSYILEYMYYSFHTLPPLGSGTFFFKSVSMHMSKKRTKAKQQDPLIWKIYDDVILLQSYLSVSSISLGHILDIMICQYFVSTFTFPTFRVSGDNKSTSHDVFASDFKCESHSLT